jgi:hypothetical protein
MMPDSRPPNVSAAQPVPTQGQPPMQRPPELENTPVKCPACDMMVTLGILTSSCEGVDDPKKRNVCKDLLKPLEEGKAQAVDALANVMVEMGEEHLDGVVERFNLLMYEAEAKAKDILVEKGVLNKDGTQKI